MNDRNHLSEEPAAEHGPPRHQKAAPLSPADSPVAGGWSQAELEDFFENAPVGLHWVGPDGRVLWVNQAELDLLGYRREEYVGHHIAEFHVNQEVINDILQRLARREVLHDYEARLRCKDDSIKHVMISSNVRWEDGQFRHTRCFTRDITERKQAEEALRFLAKANAVLIRSLDYQTTLETIVRLAVPFLADMCIIDMLSDDGSIRRLAVAHRDPGKEQLVARDGTPRFSPSLNARHGVGKVLRTGEAVLYTEVPDALLETLAQSAEHLALLRRLGFSSYMVVPLIAHGRTLGALSFVRAEPSRRYGPADLRLAQELARHGALVVDNTRLYREAQVAVRLREEFLSIAAHELKTPLTTVKGYVQLLAHRVRQLDVDQQVERMIAPVERQVRRLEMLVADLLDASRIQQGHLELRRARIDLAAVTRQVLDSFEHALEQSPRHTFVLEAPEPVVGWWDPDRLDQVLTNLLSNALKYSPAGGTVRITVRRQVGEAEVAVSDEGIGISETDRKNLFRPFVRGERSHRGIGGVGLGLYITAQIVEHHGGTIGLESEPGVGSTFTVRLPLFPPATGAQTAAEVNRQ